MPTDHHLQLKEVLIINLSTLLYSSLYNNKNLNVKMDYFH